MKITSAEFKVIEKLLPRQRGNVTVSNLQVLNAILYVAEHGCKWRGLPKNFGDWHTIYTRANRWAKKGVLDHVFAALQEHDIINIQVDHVSLDSTAVKVHPDGTGALKKTVHNRLVSRAQAGQRKFTWLQPMPEQP
jgi:transposase